MWTTPSMGLDQFAYDGCPSKRRGEGKEEDTSNKNITNNPQGSKERCHQARTERFAEYEVTKKE
eukprot:CAMPEP_0174236286 /NCGR_PEP_ID=MMETSP0417-20130205/5465_1 /TAXON_ID=242541 /ORGANISM="Mayorella sp, Strain BSH-02190019" /LENGTH=63 /DNA_ID=CAMNT_0015314899 /DNA_START=92 /DNA_END=280 /DNA_ORIENTATION=+